MATFEERIEASTQISISSSDTVPTQAEVTQFLNDGIKDVTNKVVNLKPDEAYKFYTESTDNDNSGITVKGRVLSVIRENGSTTDIRPATMIPDGLRYLATDKTSLHYRSAFNPCYYLLNSKLYVIPSPSSSTTKAIVSHLDYKTTTYADSVIADFPDEYEELALLFASAKACQAAAVNIQNNMPEKPESPEVVGFEIDGVELPDIPTYNPSWKSFDFLSSRGLSQMKSNISKDDFDKASKYSDYFEKNMAKFKQEDELFKEEYKSDSELFARKLDNLQKNADRKTQVVIAEFRSKAYKYQYDISQYNQNLQETYSRYKWYLEQYIYFMNEYSQAMQLILGQMKAPQGESPKNIKEQPKTAEEYKEEEKYG